MMSAVTDVGYGDRRRGNFNVPFVDGFIRQLWVDTNGKWHCFSLAHSSKYSPSLIGFTCIQAITTQPRVCL